MHRSLLAFGCVGLLLILGACGSGDDQSQSSADAPRTSQEARSATSYQTEPTPAPDLTLTTLEGKDINLAEQKGKVVLINFWATWCGPCRREIPDLVSLYDEWKDEGLVIVGIALDRDGAEAVKPFVDEHSINYPIVLDPDQSTEKHFDAMYGLPTTYVVNPEGMIVRRVLGIFPIEEMKPTLKEMLHNGEPSPSA